MAGYRCSTVFIGNIPIYPNLTLERGVIEFNNDLDCFYINQKLIDTKGNKANKWPSSNTH